MSLRQLMVAAMCIVAAFVLCWYHRDGAVAFLTLIGGSPLGANAGREVSIQDSDTAVRHFEEARIPCSIGPKNGD